MIRGDLHIHTDSSPDGRMSLDDLVRMLADRGYEYALITDHTIGLRFGGLDGPGLRQQHELIEEFRAGSTGLRLLHGAEVNVGPTGELDLDARTLEVLDFVVAGVHSNFDLPLEAQTERVVRALHHPSVRILSHPTGRRIGLRPPLRLDIEAVIEAAAANAVALEANGHRDRLDISAETARLAVDAGVLVAANSDAHRRDELSNVANAIATLQQAQVPARFVVNAMPWDEFARWAGLDIS